ncbi:MAG: C-GCAxxG-C-C family protein [Rikenellaceae bacterium]
MVVEVNQRVSAARDYFAKGYNCAQSVVLAFEDIMELDENSLATLAAPFGGGLGRLREVCGAVSGMALVAGKLVPCYDPSDAQSKKDNYTFVQSLCGEFRSANGSIVCRELLGLAPIREEVEGWKPTKKRPCAELVAMAAEIVARKIETLPARD